MAIEYGRTLVSKTGRDVQAISDGDHSKVKTGGVTLDASTLPTNATGSPITLVDGAVIAPGAAYMRMGQVICRIAASGKFGPYDPAASDGRQNLVPGQCYFLNKTWLDVPAGQPASGDLATLHPAAYYGGTVRSERMMFTSGTHSLAAGPTVAEFRAAFPEVQLVYG